MIKRVFSIALALCLVFALLPMNIGADGTAHSHCVCGDSSCSDGGHAHSVLSEWKGLTWDSANSKLYVDGSALTKDYLNGEQCYSLASGSYYLADSFTLGESIYVPAGNTVTLCLNGKTLTSTVTSTNGSIKVDGNLNLCDCTGTGVLTCKGFGVYVNAAETTAGSFAMYGGTISHGSSNYQKSGVFLRRNANNNTVYPSFTMYGGTISGFQGGGVEVSDHGIFTMHGGTITGNTRSGGGGVYVGSNAVFTMKNGTISNNSSSNYGGGVYARGTFTMENGEIKNNTSSNNYGGGVYVDDDQTFTMNGGSITGNSANRGSGVYISSGNFIMEKGTITGNTALYGGGGVYNNGNMTISCTATVKDNILSNSGSESTNNVELGYDKLITIGGSLSEGASIGVTMDYPPSSGSSKNITGSNNADYSRYFFSDNSGYHIENGDSNTLKLVHGAGSAPAPATYTVTFNANGGSGSMAAIDNISGSYTLPTCGFTEPDGKQFKGWATSANGNVIDTAAIDVTMDTTLYAIWEDIPSNPPTSPTTYTVTFNANGGTGNMSAQTFTEGTTQALSNNTFTREGYTFTGWNTATNGSGTAYADKQSITVDSDITFYAQWTENAPEPEPDDSIPDAPPEEEKPEPESPIIPIVPLIPTAPHSCESECPVCGRCTDTRCRESVCREKCAGAQMDYADVREGAWYYEAVQFVHHEKIMDGIGNGIFDVNGELTRAMVATILWRMEGEPAVDHSMHYTDVEPGMWYTEAVRWASAVGIVNGFEDNSFRPTDKITREQLATMLWRYAKGNGYSVSSSGWYDPITSEYAAPAMQWASGMGMLDGTAPQQNALRAETAYMLMKLLK